MINICVATLNRYDMLRDFLVSLKASTRKPDCVYIVDNGKRRDDVIAATVDTVNVAIYTPAQAMGVAEFWNFFIDHVPQTRVIVNDDLVFAPDTLEKLLACPADFPSGLAGSNAFSCFVLRDSVVARVGRFDEAISPGYAYFEDCDYAVRMESIGIQITDVSCGVEHRGSQTIKAFSEEEKREHNRKWRIAQANYIRKHGALPKGMQYQS